MKRKILAIAIAATIKANAEVLPFEFGVLDGLFENNTLAFADETAYGGKFNATQNTVEIPMSDYLLLMGYMKSEIFVDTRRSTIAYDEQIIIAAYQELAAQGISIETIRKVLSLYFTKVSETIGKGQVWNRENFLACERDLVDSKSVTVGNQTITKPAYFRVSCNVSSVINKQLNGEYGLIGKFSININTTPTARVFILTTAANPNEGGTVSLGGDYFENQRVEITQIPKSGYTFNGWTPNNCNNTKIFMPTNNLTCTATYLKSNKVTLNVTPEGSGTATHRNGKIQYLTGETVQLVATPSAGKTFKKWTPSPCANSFTMPANDLTCTAEFGNQVYPVTVSMNIANAGTITGAGNYEVGETVTLTATPNAGFKFVSWNIADCASFTMTATAKNCIATFSEIEYMNLIKTMQTTIRIEGLDVVDGKTWLVGEFVTSGNYKMLGKIENDILTEWKWVWDRTDLQTPFGISAESDKLMIANGQGNNILQYNLDGSFNKIFKDYYKYNYTHDIKKTSDGNYWILIKNNLKKVSPTGIELVTVATSIEEGKIAIDSSNNVWIVKDYVDNNQLFKYSPTGTLLENKTIEQGYYFKGIDFCPNGDMILGKFYLNAGIGVWDSNGSKKGEFGKSIFSSNNRPFAIKCLPDNSVVAAGLQTGNVYWFSKQ